MSKPNCVRSGFLAENFLRANISTTTETNMMFKPAKTEMQYNLKFTKIYSLHKEPPLNIYYL